jgi:hypothetical protein
MASGLCSCTSLDTVRKQRRISRVARASKCRTRGLGKGLRNVTHGWKNLGQHSRKVYLLFDLGAICNNSSPVHPTHLIHYQRTPTAHICLTHGCSRVQQLLLTSCVAHSEQCPAYARDRLVDCAGTQSNVSTRQGDAVPWRRTCFPV